MTAPTAPTVDHASTHPLAAAAAAAGVWFEDKGETRVSASIWGAPSKVRFRPARWFLSTYSSPSRWVLLAPAASLTFASDLVVDVCWASRSSWQPTPGRHQQGCLGDWAFVDEAHDAMVEVLAELDRLALEVPPLPDELAAQAVAP